MKDKIAAAAVPNLRGQMFRAKRQMPDAEAREFLKAQMTAHVGSVGTDGSLYVVPLVYIYENGDQLYLHTGAHQGHFLTNVQRDPRICVEVSTIGPLHKGKRFACDSALVYSSVIVFGPVRILYHDREKKSWFLDRLLAKHGRSVVGITENVKAWRTDVPARIIESLGLEKVMFEAADLDVFAWYIKNYGPEINLFVDHSQIVQLECLRRGIWGTASLWGRVLTYQS